ncbi:2OG-Fe dioxygenase family protein [Pseudomonas wadenswilerensis]
MSQNEFIEKLKKTGLVHIPTLSPWNPASPDEKELFACCWDRLMPDENFARYTKRKRRILRYTFSCEMPGKLIINRDSRYCSNKIYDIDYQTGPNDLAYCEDEFISSPVLQAVLLFDLSLCRSFLLPAQSLELDIHQFRVVADGGEVSPTTSGIHQDGYDLVFMHFIRSSNIFPVTSEVFCQSDENSLIFTKEISGFLETLIINDGKVWHRASSVKQVAQTFPAWRDMLIVSCRRSERELHR